MYKRAYIYIYLITTTFKFESRIVFRMIVNAPNKLLYVGKSYILFVLNTFDCSQN